MIKLFFSKGKSLAQVNSSSKELFCLHAPLGSFHKQAEFVSKIPDIQESHFFKSDGNNVDGEDGQDNQVPNANENVKVTGLATTPVTGLKVTISGNDYTCKESEETPYTYACNVENGLDEGTYTITASATSPSMTEATQELDIKESETETGTIIIEKPENQSLFELVIIGCLAGQKIVDNECIDECPIGTIEEGITCKLAEDTNEIVDLCATGYCLHGKCSMKGKDVKCECEENYTGLRCEVQTIEAGNEINKLYDKNFGQQEIDFTKNKQIGEIKSLTKLVKETPSTIDLEEKLAIIKSKTNEKLKDIHNRNRNVIHLIGLNLALEVRKFILRQTGRSLEETSGTKASIEQLIKDSHEYVGQLGLEELKSNKESSIYLSDSSQYLSYQVFTNDGKSVSSNLQDVTLNKASLVDLSECSDNTDKIYVVTELQQDLTSILSSDDSTSNKLILGLIQEGQTNTTIPQCGYTVKIPFSGGINEELYKFYRQRGIDIYNKNDPAFAEPCYYNDKFDYDLTQKYRKNQLFQKKQITPTLADCTYQDLDLETNLVSFSCSKYDESNLPGYNLEPQTISSSNHVDNLPTKCGSKIGDVEDNIAFWLFLILFVIFIVVDSVLAVFSLKGSVSEKALENDELLNDDYSQAKSTEAVKPEDIKPQINKTFSEIIKNNFFALHPVLSLFYSSIITPIPLTFAVFIYTIFNLFGFNALYFNETMIEDRIYDSFRNNFAYPMKTEFEKIMSSIATSIALNIIVRLICLVTLSQKQQLGEALKNNKKEMREEVNKFSMGFLPRRIIAGIFMLALSVFFYYYCVVFCGIYTNTQYGWFYSGIWSLLWNWIVYAPIYILVISLVENSGKTGCAYYMKKLFIF